MERAWGVVERGRWVWMVVVVDGRRMGEAEVAEGWSVLRRECCGCNDVVWRDREGVVGVLIAFLRARRSWGVGAFMMKWLR